MRPKTFWPAILLAPDTGRLLRPKRPYVVFRGCGLTLERCTFERCVGQSVGSHQRYMQHTLIVALQCLLLGVAVAKKKPPLQQDPEPEPVSTLLPTILCILVCWVLPLVLLKLSTLDPIKKQLYRAVIARYIGV